MNSVHYSSDSDEWETPQWLFDELNAEFDFGFDLACTSMNSKCRRGATIDTGYDALSKTLAVPKNMSVWCNPPYSRGLQKQFLALGADLKRKGITSVFLVPARTDTKAWHDYIWDTENHKPKSGVEVRFLKGRLKFEKGGEPILDKHDRPQSAPFPSAVIIFRG